MLYQWIKLIHIISSTLLFGTGLGSAFYMYRANRTRNPNVMLFAARNVVIADWIFTTPSVVVQPLTGFTMIYLAGYAVSSAWIVWSLILYVFVGACWIPVVYLQIRMHRLLKQTVARNEALPEKYWRDFRIWFTLGWPAFIGVLVIFWLMLLKPSW